MKKDLSKSVLILKYASLILSALPFCISVLSVFFMSEKIPMHYNSSGEADRFGNNTEFVLIGFLFTLTALIMPIAFDRIKMVDYGKLIGFLSAIVMSVAFICLTSYFVSKVFEISGKIKLGNGKEVSAFICAIIGGIIFIFGSISYYLFRGVLHFKFKGAEIILPIIFSVCGSLVMLLCIFVKNYYSILILLIGLAVIITSTVMTVNKKYKVNIKDRVTKE